MKNSIWFSTIDNDGVFVHYLISPMPHVPCEHGDLKLCEMIGQLDPFVSAVETGCDIPLESTHLVLGFEVNEKKRVG